MLTHVRLNNGQQGNKTLKSRMIDSTYLNAADPNSMRDLGMIRNAEYTWNASNGSNINGEYRGYKNPIKTEDKGSYSFGSK